MDFSFLLMLSNYSIEELDALIQNARVRKAHLEHKEKGLESVRKEIFMRIASSGYSMEDIFDGSGKFPQALLKRIAERSRQ